MCENANLTAIPTEVLTRIFSFLPLHSVRCVAPLVCKRWKDIIEQPDVWRLKWLKCSNKPMGLDWVTLKALPAFLKATPVRHMSLFLEDFSETLEVVLEVLTACPKLRSFSFEVNDVFFEDSCSEFRFKMSEDEDHRVVITINRSNKVPSLPLDVFIRRLGVIFPDLRSFGLFALQPVELTELSSFRDLQRLGIGTTHCSATDLVKLKSLTSIKRLTILEQCPTAEKLAALGQLPMVDLELIEGVNVITPSVLLSFFDSNSFTALTELKMDRGHITNEVAKAIRLNCTCLRLIDIAVEPLPTFKPLTKQEGLLHLLHLPQLYKIDIRFILTLDWNYKRYKFEHHECEPSLPCPVGINTLLRLWTEQAVDPCALDHVNFIPKY